MVEAEQAYKVGWDGPKFVGPIQVRLRLHKKHVQVYITDMPDHKSRLKGDVDNYAKLVLDGLNGVAYNDDKQVMRLIVEKVNDQ